MAKQNDIAYKALNIGIVGVVLIGLFFLWKWAKNHMGGNGGTLFGGSGKEKTYGNGHGATNSGSGDIISKISQKAADDLKNVPHTLIIGTQLVNANRQAKNYTDKMGTNPYINKTILEANKLSDHDFMIAIKEFLALSNYDNLYDSALAGNVTNTGAKSIFLSRYGTLTGQINSNAAYSAHSLAKA